MTYTHTNPRDVDDAAPRIGVGAHRHEQAEEIYVVLSASGRMKLDDDIVSLAPLDAIRVAPAVTRAVEGGPNGIQYLVTGPHHEADGTVRPIEEFWS